MITIASDLLAAEIEPLGAELKSLTDAHGGEYMSSGDPAFWTGRAPLLFPIVGRLHEDTLRIDGAKFAMAKHGFARRSTFVVIEQTPDAATFRLADTPHTHAQFPFAFELDARFALEGCTLAMSVIVRNTGDVPLPASFGYHPAFAWPLPGGGARSDHNIAFAKNEPTSLRVLTEAGLIASETRTSPVVGRNLRLEDSLFARDVLIWTDLASRSLRYGSDKAWLDIAFPDTEWLGIWTKPGAAFICVEPWAGLADPDGYEGDFRAKPGVMTLDPGAERSFRMDVTVRI